MTSQDSWNLPGGDWESREAAGRSGAGGSHWLEEGSAARDKFALRPLPGNRRRARRQIAREIERLQSELAGYDDDIPEEDFTSAAEAVATLAEQARRAGPQARALVARLAGQLADIADNGERSAGAADSGAPRPSGQAELAEIATILRRIGERPGAKQRFAAAGDRDAILGDLRDGVAALGEAPASSHREVRPAAERVADLNRSITHLKARLAALRNAGELGARPAPAPVADADGGGAGWDFKKAVAAIAARQEALDRASRAADAKDAGEAPAIGQAPFAPVFAAEDSATALRSPEDPGPLGRGASDELAPSGSAIYPEIGQMRSALGGAAPEPTLRSLEAGYDPIQRLGSASRAMPERGRTDQFAGAAEEIGRPLADSRPEGGLSHIETQIADLARAVEHAADRDAVGALDRRLEEIGSALQSLEALGRQSEKDAERRFGEMERALAGASLGSGGEFVDRLDRRLDELSGRLDRAMEGGPSGDAAGALVARIEAVAERIDATLAERLAPQAEAIDALSREIGSLRLEISLGARPAITALEAQMQALTKRLDTIPAPLHDSAALSQIEAQVARLADRIETVAARPVELERVDANLAALEALLQQRTGESVQAAQAAAREAVKALSGTLPAGDDAVVQGLKDDLRTLQAAADNRDLRTQDAIGTVEAALARVSERLAGLEQSPRRAAAGEAASVRSPAPERSAVPVARMAEAAPAANVVTDEPVLELGRTAETPADRRADFIAAARRAARAAAAESASLRQAEASERRGPFARIGDLFKRRRRPLLLAAAAVVLTIAALKLFAVFSDRGSVSMAKADAAPATQVAGRPAGRAEANSAANRTAAVVDAAPADPAPAAAAAASFVDPGGAFAFAAPDLPSRFGTSVLGPSPVAFAPAPTIGAAGPATRSFTTPDTITVAPAPAVVAAVSTTVPGQGEAAARQTGPIADTSVGPTELRKAAAAGDAAAIFEIASRYAEGRIVAQDLRVAANWYGEAARRGHAVAAVRLAALYENGKGVERDAATAASWYQKAAEAGNIRAMHNLGVLFSEGIGEKPDFGAAADWFTKAAERGVKDSQYNLGVIFARGLGREQDLMQAYRWFALAAAQGDTEAGSRRDEVAKSLPADKLAQARTAVQAWRATKAPEVANVEPTPKAAWAGGPEKPVALSHPDLVRRVQALLLQKGFDPGPADGTEGAKTKAAVKAAQAKLGVPATGTIDTALYAALGGV